MGASVSIVGGKEEFLRCLSQYEELKAKGASHDEIYSKLSEIENETEHIDHETEMRARGEKLIFISINVSTMLNSAKILQTELKKQGYRVWVCTDMMGGVDFRDSIVQAVKQCHIFIPMINNAWALSGECRDEFSLAKRLHLTSHESGRSDKSKNEPRLPVFIPIAFSDLQWNEHSHIQLLASSTNFLVHDAVSLECGNVQKRIDALLLSMHGVGCTVDLPERLVKETIKERELMIDSDGKVLGPHEQLLNITESLKAFATSIETVAYNNARQDEERKNGLARVAGAENIQNARLRNQYLGVSKGSIQLNAHARMGGVEVPQEMFGFHLCWWNSLQFTVTSFNDDTNELEADIVETNLRRQVTNTDDKFIDDTDLPIELNGKPNPVSHYSSRKKIRTSKFVGIYKPSECVVSGKATRVKEEDLDNTICEVVPIKYDYHFVVRSSELVGIQLELKDNENYTKDSSVAPVVLDLIS